MLKPLAQVHMGRTVRISSFTKDCCPQVAGRLLDLGFRPGTIIETIRRAPFGRPVQYRLNGINVALRPAQIDVIQVEQADDFDNDTPRG